jgi:CheY-like chemotaxis protein
MSCRCLPLTPRDTRLVGMVRAYLSEWLADPVDPNGPVSRAVLLPPPAPAVLVLVAASPPEPAVLASLLRSLDRGNPFTLLVAAAPARTTHEDLLARLDAYIAARLHWPEEAPALVHLVQERLRADRHVARARQHAGASLCTDRRAPALPLAAARPRSPGLRCRAGFPFPEWRKPHMKIIPFPVDVERAEEPAQTPPTGGTPCVLAVDDNQFVREILVEGLGRYGFTVLAASSGKEAASLYRQFHAGIVAVLLDVAMPGLDGPQTLTLLRRINPQVHTLFLTGYGHRYTEADLLSLGAARVFRKPFDLGEIAQALGPSRLRRMP